MNLLQNYYSNKYFEYSMFESALLIWIMNLLQNAYYLDFIYK